MPKGKTKKFIEKKNSVTFHLVHRSQKDPLIADETAPQRVLVPLTGQAPKSERKPQDEKNKRKEEEHKYGIYFDDDYDYLQHLRDVRTLTTEWERVEPAKERPENKAAQKINLPSSVFESNVEEKVGLLNKAAPTGLQLDVDPDIVAAMDDDFDFDDPENQLEDNFIELANVENADGEFAGDKEYEYDSDGMTDDEEEEEEGDELASLNGARYSFREEETKSRFTEYSMSSSVMRRNEQLTLLDDKFERMYAAYDESEIGALDCDEIEGHVPADADILLQCAAEFEEQQREHQQRYTDAENVAQLMRERMKIMERECPSSGDETDLEKLLVDAREKEKWDCESIISTYSNIYNHPKLIAEPKGPGKIKVDPRTGIPRNVLNSNAGKLTVKSLAEFDQQNENLRLKGEPQSSQSIAETMRSTLSTLSIRPKGETPEERKERKKALKGYRKERRLERKANTEAFKEEKKRQEKIMLNNRQNVQGNRIL